MAGIEDSLETGKWKPSAFEIYESVKEVMAHFTASLLSGCSLPALLLMKHASVHSRNLETEETRCRAQSTKPHAQILLGLCMFLCFLSKIATMITTTTKTIADIAAITTA
jgi:hypothetical protein